MAVVTTGMVIKKIISSTNITSTKGVVLIAEITASSSSELEPTFMAMVFLPLNYLPARQDLKAALAWALAVNARELNRLPPAINL
jgi:hypothetical protein